LEEPTRWKNQQFTQSGPPDKTVSVDELLQKVDQLHKQLDQTQTEREILKKVVAIFSKSA